MKQVIAAAFFGAATALAAPQHQWEHDGKAWHIGDAWNQAAPTFTYLVSKPSATSTTIGQASSSTSSRARPTDLQLTKFALDTDNTRLSHYYNNPSNFTEAELAAIGAGSLSTNNFKAISNNPQVTHSCPWQNGLLDSSSATTASAAPQDDDAHAQPCPTIQLAPPLRQSLLPSAPS